MQIPVVGPTYTNDSRAFDAQRCVNFFPESSEVGTSKTPNKLVGCPGLTSPVATLGSGPIRAAIVTEGGKLYAVSGNTVYHIAADWTATSLGTISTSIGVVSMADNGTYVGIVDGTQGYYITTSTDTLAQISDADFPDDATVIEYQDTYFIVNRPSNGQYAISGNNDITSWAAVDRKTVQSTPTSLVSLLSDHGELVVAGSKKMEVHYNSGAAAFPFDRVPQAVLEVGCAAAHTLKKFDNNYLWVSEGEKGERFVYKMNESYRPIRVSNVSVEKALESVADISEAYAFVYSQRGHEFYMLQIPGVMVTWVFDAREQMWHERMYYNAQIGREEQHRASCHVFFNGKHIVGDRESGNLYELSLDVFTDNGDPIHGIRITPHLTDEMRNTTCFSLHLDMETGVGLVGDDDPEVMMRASRDGGRSFGTEQLSSFGKLGEFEQRARWTRLGLARDWVYQFRITDPVQRVIIGAYAEFGRGAH